MSSEFYYVSTAIAYMNSEPHLGHAYEFIIGDVIARINRLLGKNVKIVTGSDEHGQKVCNSAKAKNVSPQTFVDELVKKFYKLNSLINMSEHVYVRTTSEEHKKTAIWLWNTVYSKGDIYKGTYEGWYNVKEETFITNVDAALTNYKCPISGMPYEKKKEICYFFRMSKYHEQVEDLIENTNFLMPVDKKLNLLNRLKNEKLTDLCISRSDFDWGIKVPNDSSQIIYVWFDALANYLTGIDYLNTKEKNVYWPANVHIIGKDIIWFHCVIWPAILMSANIPVPRHVFAHGFIQAADGHKMSKSLHNGITPDECLEFVESDTFRYYLIKEAHTGSDIKFSIDSLVYMHNADLCNTIGNLVNRAVKLGMKYNEGVIKKVEYIPLYDIKSIYIQICSFIENFELDKIAIYGLNLCKDANKYLTDKEPWKLKNNPDEAYKIIYATLDCLYVANHILNPFIVNASNKIFQYLGCNMSNLVDLEKSHNLKEGSILCCEEILFKPLSLSEIDININKTNS